MSLTNYTSRVRIAPTMIITALIMLTSTGLTAMTGLRTGESSLVSPNRWGKADIQSAEAEQAPGVASQDPANSQSDQRKTVEIPTGLVIVLTAGIALVLFFLFKSFVERVRRSKDEVIIRTGDPIPRYEQDSKTPGSYQRQAETSSGETSGQAPEKASPSENKFPEYRVPTQKPDTGQIKRKGGVWPTIILAIVVINILRQCLQNR